LEDNNEAHPQT